MTSAVQSNGILSPPPTEKANSVSASPARVVLSGKTGRILCVADIRGDYHELNRLIREHEATAVIHTGDFGFMTSDSMERMGDKILRHLVQYSPLIPPATRGQILANASQPRKALIEQLNNSSIHFPLSQFPHLLTGAITFPVPVFTVWGLVEDVRVLEKFRTGEYDVQNLSIIDEATTRLIEVGGLKLRLFGLGGTIAPHKLFDNGDGYATIAGGAGTMWSTALQMGELIDTAQRVFDQTETRLFISSAPVSRNGVLSQIANALKADLTISGGLHFRYPVSFNEFSINPDYEAYTQKLTNSQKSFVHVYEAVRDKVDSSLDDQQQALLKKILTVVRNVPASDDGTWTNSWHWVLSDASCGHLLLSVSDSRVSAETKSSGLNFSHRTAKGPAPSSSSGPGVSATLASAASRQEPAATVKQVAPTRAPIGPGGPATTNKPSTPAGALAPTTTSFKTPQNKTIAPQAKPSGASATPAATASSALAPSMIPTAAVAPSAIPAKPPTQPRQARGQNSPAGLSPNASATNSGKDKSAESKPAHTVPAAAKEKEKNPAHSHSAKVNTPAVNGKSSTASTKVPEKLVKDETKKETAAPAGTAKIDGDKTPAIAPVTEAKDGEKSSHNREGSGEVKPKRHSLYVKGIPIPTSEDELKALFGDVAAKITSVNIIRDHITKAQKDFAYVDFGTEDEMNSALEAKKETVRDATVSVTVSNPPARRFNDGPFRGSRGGRGGSFRGARGRGFGSISGGVGGRREGGEGGFAGEKKE